MNNVVLISRQTKKCRIFAFRRCTSCYQFEHAQRKCSPKSQRSSINIRFVRPTFKYSIIWFFTQILHNCTCDWSINKRIAIARCITIKSTVASSDQTNVCGELSVSRREKLPRALPAPLEDDGNEERRSMLERKEVEALRPTFTLGVIEQR